MGSDSRFIAKLTFDAMEKNAPVLIFCNTRKRCVDLCRSLTAAYKAVYKEQLPVMSKVSEELSGGGGVEVHTAAPDRTVKGLLLIPRHL